MQCYCFNDMVNQSYGNNPTCSVRCDPYVCGSTNNYAVSVYKRLEADRSK